MPISLVRDANRIPVIGATSNGDGVTVIAVQVHESNHSVIVSDSTTGTSKASVNAQRDANRVPVMWGLSSADGVTPIPIYISAVNKLLIDST